mgnify:CR=1 FL=1
MQNSYSDSYAAAGVDVTAGYESVELIKAHVKKTVIPGVLGGIGGFGGMFELPLGDYQNPVLVSGTDGVGTKIKLAQLMDKHDTIGIDCVAMCVNDVACSGAKPLFFLDYIACGKNYPKKIEQIVKGVADGCVMAGCALVGGETAEHPGVMADDDYDLAGFTVGIGEKDRLVSGEHLKAGNALIGVASSGIHSNGFSLIRKVFNINEDTIKVHYDELGSTLGEELITPTRIYVKPLLTLMESVRVNAISHITGGGFYENVPRMLNDDTLAVIEKDKCFSKPIFDLIQKTGAIPEHDMYNTFNMGTGLVIAVDSDKADEAVRLLNAAGEQAAVIGEVKNGEKGVELL